MSSAMKSNSKVLHWLSADFRILRKRIDVLAASSQWDGSMNSCAADLVDTSSTISLHTVPVAKSETIAPLTLALYSLIVGSEHVLLPLVLPQAAVLHSGEWLPSIGAPNVSHSVSSLFTEFWIHMQWSLYQASSTLCFLTIVIMVQDMLVAQIRQNSC